jgi:hypothetical protein
LDRWCQIQGIGLEVWVPKPWTSEPRVEANRSNDASTDRSICLLTAASGTSLWAVEKVADYDVRKFHDSLNLA